jgi:hypothetical protein
MPLAQEEESSLDLGVTVYAYLIIKSHDEESLNAFE